MYCTAKMFANIFGCFFVNTKSQMVDNQNPDDGVSLIYKSYRNDNYDE